MNPIQSPIAQYVGLNGKPLDAGYVHIGEANQNPETNPISVYWDEASTQPAVQPLRTMNGYISRNGAPADIYVAGDYSITVRDAHNRLVIYKASCIEPTEGVFEELASPSGASLVGYGDATIASLLLSGIGHVVSSIADLKGTDHTEYTKACVTGYYAAGDGGGGFYYYDSADTTSTDNGGTIIVDDDGGRWKLATTNSVSVRQFGAKGDGATDDFAAFQACIDFAVALGKKVIAPAGKYRIGQRLVVTLPNGAGWTTTSTTSNTIGTGAKTFTVGAGIPITVGDPVTASAGTFGQGYMTGTVTSYSGTSLEINVTVVSGSGTYSGWDVVRNYKNTNAIAPFTIEGDGQDETILYFPDSNGFLVNFSSQQHTVHMRKLSVTTGSLTTRTGVELTNSYPYFGTFVAQSDFTDVTFRGDTGYSRGSSAWGICVRVTKVSDINFNNVDFLGSGIPSGSGLVISSPGAGSFDAPVTTATVFNLVNCNFTFLSVGIRYGENTQTLQVVNSFFAQNTTDIYVPPDAGSLQGLTVNGNTFFKGAAGDIIYSGSPVPNLIITNNFFTCHAGNRAIALDAANNTTIVGNQFLPGDTPNGAVAAIDINGSDAGSLTIIDGNTFSSTTIGVRLLDGAKGVTIGPGNTATSNMLLFTQSGMATGNTIFDGLKSRNAGYVVGYGEGAGATVTQSTSKTTGVTLNRPTGRITTHNQSLAGGAELAFTVTNSVVSAEDTIILTNGNGNYSVRPYGVINGSFVIAIKNITGGALGDAVTINFAVIKGATS